MAITFRVDTVEATRDGTGQVRLDVFALDAAGKLRTAMEAEAVKAEAK